MQIDPRQLDLFGVSDLSGRLALQASPEKKLDPAAHGCPPNAVAVTSLIASEVLGKPVVGSDESAGTIRGGQEPLSCLSAVLVKPEAVEPATEEAQHLILPAAVMTLAEHDNLMARIVDGEVAVTPVEVRSSFERLIRDVEAVRGEVSKFKVADLLKKIARAGTTPYLHDKKKAYLVERLIDALVLAYGFLTVTNGVLSIQGVGFVQRCDAIRRKLAGLTAEHLGAYRASVHAERAARTEKVKAYLKAVKAPETLEEFEIFLRERGESEFTPEMRARRDELVAERLRLQDGQRKAEQGIVAGVSTSAGMQIVETKHTRDGHDLFVVTLSERVEREQYDALNAAAKRLSGRYSSYRRDGAVPGFQFKTREGAEQFLKVGLGETVSNAEQIEARQTQKETQAANKLKDLATRTQEAAEAELNRERLTNTPKRAGQASAAQEEARKNIALAKTMHNLADAIASGDAKHLDRLTDKAQVVMFEKCISLAKSHEIKATSDGYAEELKRRGEAATLATIEYVEYPTFRVYVPAQLDSLIDHIKEMPGLMRIAPKLKPYLNEAYRDDRAGVSVPVELIEPVIDKLGRENPRLLNNWGEIYARRKRLERMGIKTPEQFRAACREFLQYRQAREKADRATELERALVGKKVGFDFFPTPKTVCSDLVARALRACPSPGKRWCEPQAGNGNIATAMRDAGYEPDVAEISPALSEILVAKGFNVIGSDFLEIEGVEYDVIIQNPPFSNFADIKHARHAYSLLADGGVLVSIIGESAFFRNDAQAVQFREWLDEVDAEVEKLPQGTFLDKTLLQTTGANARVITIVR
ncbi:methyltransferase domain-containing protein [Paraburkholderia sp. SIMBA_054]|uniref:methyltransferase domain-containing protein n=1 Tax=Paraburkholderia sp. SIMBA_054 TaxID=3085795 RepID=UPI00397DF162